MTITEARKTKIMGKAGIYGISPCRGSTVTYFLFHWVSNPPQKTAFFGDPPLWQKYHFWRFFVCIMGADKIIRCFELSIYNSNKICGRAKKLFPVTGCPKNMQKGEPFFTSKCHFLWFIVSITEARKQIKQ